MSAPASHPRTDRRAGARGQVLAMTAVSLIALCALVGLAADTGYFFDNRRRIQTAAAAALAGAEQLRRAGTTQVVTAANSAATANGFTDGVSGTTITVGGNSALSDNFSTLANGNPVKKVTLAE